MTRERMLLETVIALSRFVSQTEISEPSEESIEQTREQPERKVPQPFAELIFMGVDRDSTLRLAEHGYGIYRIADVEAGCK